ncbi:MAG: adenosylcobalamin-dependent ribonucleoside-diphosphate reductase [Rhizobiales bacterium]|nr:adenosylcobalamin-dependent ribonucleoside-diphosphate reductase [Hyphomicrobiales bacterium]
MIADPIAREIWDMKYRLKQPDGEPVDQTIEDTWRRVARAVAQAESPQARAHWAEDFYDLLAGYRFLPAGRILSGAGSGRSVTLFNCYVMGTLDDSMAGIFEGLKEAALTMQQGGGIGHDFSTLRPKGAPVKGVGADASGPLSFMDVWDSMCRTIMSAGSRRGAMMGTLACDHPDIEAFIAAKRDPNRLRMFNLSVLVTDAFMEAVKTDAPWPLVFAGTVYKTLRARDLWDQIMRSTYDYAEPGVIFIDRINRENNLAYCETIHATNPCGEEPLPPYGACLLGSVNLTRLVIDPFTDKARIDEAAIEDIVPRAVRFMDNVVDVSNYPLAEQAHEARAKRRLGLGLTGLADALAMCGLAYGSEEAAAAAGHWMALIDHAAYRASSALAHEKGSFPLYDRERYLAGGHVKSLPKDVRGEIAKHGIRNALLTSIAPTGTISLFAGNVSSGIEPIFSISYERKVLMPDGSRRSEKVEDYAARLYRAMHGADAPLPPSFVTTAELEPHQHLIMQAAVQRHVDSSISKTINCPPSLGFEAFKAVYAQAYELGLKGCTTFRPNAVTGSVLSAAESAGPAQPALPLEAPRDPALHSEPGEVIYMKRPLERREVLPGFTYKLKWPESDHAIYITLNDIVQDGRRRPFEIFINSKNMEHYAWTVALTRMISAVFRRGGDVSFVVEELKAVFDPRGGQWMGGKYVPSLLAAIGGVIEKHLVDTGFLKRNADSPALVPTVAMVAGDRQGVAQCPRCGEAGLIFQEGCAYCPNCGYSKCG